MAKVTNSNSLLLIRCASVSMTGKLCEKAGQALRKGLELRAGVAQYILQSCPGCIFKEDILPGSRE